MTLDVVALAPSVHYDLCARESGCDSALTERTSSVRLQLAAELQTCRTLAGISQREMAAALRISQSLVSRAERGTRLLSRPDTMQWLHAVHAEEKVYRRVLGLTEAAHTETRTWAELLGSQHLLQEDVRARNADAALIREFQPTVLPSLLQTADYARSVIPLADVTTAVDHAAALAARIVRQDVLREPGHRFEFLVTERLLWWEPTPGVLRPQLAQLIAVAALPSVTLAVLPERFARALPWHNFVLRVPADGAPPYVAVEAVHGEQIVDDPASVTVYDELWQRMWAAAVIGRDAADRIRAAFDTDAERRG